MWVLVWVWRGSVMRSSRHSLPFRQWEGQGRGRGRGRGRLGKSRRRVMGRRSMGRRGRGRRGQSRRGRGRGHGGAELSPRFINLAALVLDQLSKPRARQIASFRVMVRVAEQAAGHSPWHGRLA